MTILWIISKNSGPTVVQVVRAKLANYKCSHVINIRNVRGVRKRLSLYYTKRRSLFRNWTWKVHLSFIITFSESAGFLIRWMTFSFCKVSHLKVCKAERNLWLKKSALTIFWWDIFTLACISHRFLTIISSDVIRLVHHILLNKTPRFAAFSKLWPLAILRFLLVVLQTNFLNEF